MRGERRRPTPHLGAQLHARNRYRRAPPDFFALAAQYPSFRQYVRNVNDEKQMAALAWDDPFAVRELTKTLLLHDFQLQWEMPIDRLCPPDLLLDANVDPFAAADSNATSATDSSASTHEPIRGIDVGTGASCIYALLGARLNDWRFVATEIDAESFASAQANVARNALGDRISVRKVATTQLLLEPLAQAHDQRRSAETTYHFAMCNPPFFGDMSEADTNPQASCMGSASEMVFPGGEVAFVGHMIADSLVLRTRVLWYTSMVGRKASLRRILAALREQQVPHMRTTEFFQGRTKRWGVAWTFSAALASDTSASSYKVLGKRKEAHRRREMAFAVPFASGSDGGCATLREVVDRVREFAARDPSVVIDVSGGGTDDSEDEDEDAGAGEAKHDRDDAAALDDNYAFFRIQSAASADNDASGNAFQGRVEISSDAAAATRGFEVTVAYEGGARGAFWKAADALKAATVRSGRQWRRRRLVERQDDTGEDAQQHP
ncbi:hypothetical protein PybrP1_004692 [[Pythium] brassicae (nom. inval.)]|nr:hypothetical protein PybrP1_004692 [[Pythium] brassicae (nom. inval.)]